MDGALAGALPHIRDPAGGALNRAAQARMATVTTLDPQPADERRRIQRRNSVRMALVLAAAAAMVFAGYIWQVARMAG